MRRTFFSFLGIILILASLAGIAISAYGVIGLWRIEKDTKTSLDETLVLLDTTLQITTDGLSIASGSLTQAHDSLGTLATTVQTSGKSVEDTVPMIDALTQVATEDLPGTISSTQKALESAQAAASIIDSTLAALTSIPFLFLQPYDSQMPLSTALVEISESLTPISTTLSSMEESLINTKGNLSLIHDLSVEIADNITTIQSSLNEAQGIISQYLEVIETLRGQVAQGRENLPGTLDGIARFITVVLIWLGLTQIGLVMQGLEMLGLKFEKETQAPPEPIKTSQEELEG